MKQFTIPFTYRSRLISSIKEKRKKLDKMKKDFSPTEIDLGSVKFYLARHFGFCYGVENAIEIAFRTIENNPGKRIFLLSEMIHNPSVNADLLSRGVQFLQDTKGNSLIDMNTLHSDDVVIIPAFGTTIEMEQFLIAKGIQTEKYNTTCPFVEKVWNRSEQIAKKNYTVIVHGKPSHEETRATFSHAAYHTPTLVINDMKEAIVLASFINGEKNPETFYQVFENRYSPGFDVEKDLQRIGVVNQTTMLASDTQGIADFLKQVIRSRYSLTDDTIQEHFAETRDTLCYATNDNQSAVFGMLETKADLAIVVGGYNSSNTSHLVELCEEKLRTYHIDHPDRIVDEQTIVHYKFEEGKTYTSNAFLQETKPIRILITSGASCPDSLVENVLYKIAGFLQVTDKLEDFKSQWLEHFEEETN